MLPSWLCFVKLQKSQKSEEEQAKVTALEQFRQYKAKAKVILQKQKDELQALCQQSKELDTAQQEVSRLKEQLKALSSEDWASKCQELEKELAAQKQEVQHRKVELAEAQSAVLLKERQLAIQQEEFQKERGDIRGEVESELAESKRKFARKLEEYRVRAREMLQEKEKQLVMARSRLKNARNGSVSPMDTATAPDINNAYRFSAELRFDKETQTAFEPLYSVHTEPLQFDHHAVDSKAASMVMEEQPIQSTDDLVAALRPPVSAALDGQVRAVDETKDSDSVSPLVGGSDNLDQMISAQNIAVLAQMQAQRDHKLREFQDRLRRLQELLNKSEDEHKRKDSELERIQARYAQIAQAQDVKRSVDNSEYLKNALLQYFDGRIAIEQLLQIAAVGLSFNEEEKRKARDGKRMTEQTSAMGGVFGSWW